MTEVDDVIKPANLALVTGRVKNARPASMLLMRDTKTGKILKVFMNLKCVIWANDLSPRESAQLPLLASGTMQLDLPQVGRKSL